VERVVLCSATLRAGSLAGPIRDPLTGLIARRTVWQQTPDVAVPRYERTNESTENDDGDANGLLPGGGLLVIIISTRGVASTTPNGHMTTTPVFGLPNDDDEEALTNSIMEEWKNHDYNSGGEDDDLGFLFADDKEDVAVAVAVDGTFAATIAGSADDNDDNAATTTRSSNNKATAMDDSLLSTSSSSFSFPPSWRGDNDDNDDSNPITMTGRTTTKATTGSEGSCCYGSSSSSSAMAAWTNNFQQYHDPKMMFVSHQHQHAEEDDSKHGYYYDCYGHYGRAAAPNEQWPTIRGVTRRGTTNQQPPMGRPLLKRGRPHGATSTTTTTVKRAKTGEGPYHHNHHNWNQHSTAPAAAHYYYYNDQTTLMNQPVEHDYDILVADHGLLLAGGWSTSHNNNHHHHSTMAGSVGWHDTNVAGRCMVKNDNGDGVVVVVNDDGATLLRSSGHRSNVVVGLHSWQMDVLHRLIQHLPPVPQAAVKSIAARAIERHLLAGGHDDYYGDVKYQHHLPGAIFEDVMQLVSTEYIALFRQSFLAVGRDRQQQQQQHKVVVTATAVAIPKTTITQQRGPSSPHPVISPLQLAMGYAFVLGMRHAQTTTTTTPSSSSSSSLDESLLDQARTQMYEVAPSERCRVWNEFVAASLAKNNTNNKNNDDGPVGGGGTDGVDPSSW
jgi:hypothetical protein